MALLCADYNEASPYHFPLLFLFLQAKQKGKAAPLAPQIALQNQLLCQAAGSGTPGVEEKQRTTSLFLYALCSHKGICKCTEHGVLQDQLLQCVAFWGCKRATVGKRENTAVKCLQNSKNDPLLNPASKSLLRPHRDLARQLQEVLMGEVSQVLWEVNNPFWWSTVGKCSCMAHTLFWLLSVVYTVALIEFS